MKMKRFSVLFDVRQYNGEITVEAETAEEAHQLVSAMTLDSLIEHTNSVGVEIESVEEL